jgi:hypothetical protein
VRRFCLYSFVIYRGIHTDRARSECAALSRRAPNHSERAARSLAGEPRTARAERSPLLAREESFGREMAGYFSLVGHDFHRNRKGSLTCHKYKTRDPQLYFPSEGRHAQDFLRPEKIRRLWPGLNPRSWVPEASMLTTRPPKPLHPRRLEPLLLTYRSTKGIKVHNLPVKFRCHCQITG